MGSFWEGSKNADTIHEAMERKQEVSEHFGQSYYDI
jgi:hypothetical protein